jgi:hypothetical protein
MLPPVPLSVFRAEVRAEVLLPGLPRVRGLPGDRIEFVIAHNRLRAPGLHHAAHDVHGTDLGWPAIHKISDKEGLPPGVAPSAVAVLIAELG